MFAVMREQLMGFVKDSDISIIPRLLLNAGVQFGIAGLGITIVCILRKEKFTAFGLTRKNAARQQWERFYVLSPRSVIFLPADSSTVIGLSAFW